MRKKLSLIFALCFAFMLVFAMHASAFPSTFAQEIGMPDNNTASGAMRIDEFKTVRGNISSSDDVDWYEVPMAQGNGTLTIKFEHEKVNVSNIQSDVVWQIGLYDDSAVNGLVTNNVRWFNVTGTEDITLPRIGVSAAGAYVCVRCGNPGTVYQNHSNALYYITFNREFDEVWETENNGTASAADEIFGDTPISGTIAHYQDYDWYKFYAENDGYFTVDFTHPVTNLSNNQSDDVWDVSIYNSTAESGIFRAAATEYGVTGKEDLKTGALGVKGGQYYYVKVTCGNTGTAYYNHSPLEYQLKINYTETEYFEKEANGSSSKATEMKVNRKYGASITTGADDDWFKFTLASQSSVSFSFEHEAFSYSSSGETIFWYMYIYDSSASKVPSALDFKYVKIYDGSDFTSKKYDLPAGDYYIKITDKSDGTNHQTDRTYFVSVEEDHNHSYGSSTPNGDKHEWACTICGETKSEYHDWNSGSVTQKPTCTEPGVKTYKCWTCKTTKTEPVPAAHSFGSYTDQGDGTHKRLCTLCDAYETDAHAWNDGVVTKKPTCAATGTKLFGCTMCSAEKTETLAVSDEHSSLKYEKQDENYHNESCTLCGNSSVAAHVFNVVRFIDKDYHEASCPCGAYVINQHNYSDWVITEEATEDSGGWKKRTCSDCDHTDRVSIPAGSSSDSEGSSDADSEGTSGSDNQSNSGGENNGMPTFILGPALSMFGALLIALIVILIRKLTGAYKKK